MKTNADKINALLLKACKQLKKDNFAGDTAVEQFINYNFYIEKISNAINHYKNNYEKSFKLDICQLYGLSYIFKSNKKNADYLIKLNTLITKYFEEV